MYKYIYVFIFSVVSKFIKMNVELQGIADFFKHFYWLELSCLHTN